MNPLIKRIEMNFGDVNIVSIIYKYRYVKLKTLIVLLLSFLNFSCKKFVEVAPPVAGLNESNVYSTDQSAISVLTGIYARMSLNDATSGGITSLSFYNALSADELKLHTGISTFSLIRYYTNSLNASNTGGIDFWSQIYPTIFVSNAAIEGITNSQTLTADIKKQLLGEAKFMRAFCYFYLVNLFRDVPLILNTDYPTNSILSRTQSDLVWQQIIADLKEAKDLLSPNYLKADLLSTTTERVRPTKWAASALLSRTYLFTKDYAKAENEATEIINNKLLYDTVPLGNVFLKNSKEAIWQLQPVVIGFNTQDARTFIIPSTGPSGSYPVYLSNNLLNSFETGDGRKTNWINSVTPTSPGNLTYYFPYKYKATTGTVVEYLMVLRLSEQYLIRAEARAQQNKIDDGKQDLNIIRSRARLSSSNANDKNTLLAETLHERQVELFTEWGHRWLDLKRTGNIDVVMNVITPTKGGNWNPNWQWYPIPLNEIMKNPNLEQNEGYEK